MVGRYAARMLRAAPPRPQKRPAGMVKAAAGRQGANWYASSRQQERCKGRAAVRCVGIQHGRRPKRNQPVGLLLPQGTGSTLVVVWDAGGR